MSGAVGPFVGPWIRSVGTEYAIEVDGDVLFQYESPSRATCDLLLQAGRTPFPFDAVRYKLILGADQRKPLSARVYLR